MKQRSARRKIDPYTLRLAGQVAQPFVDTSSAMGQRGLRSEVQRPRPKAQGLTKGRGGLQVWRREGPSVGSLIDYRMAEDGSSTQLDEAAHQWRMMG